MWIYENKEFTEDMVPEGAFGFVYIMKAVIDGKEWYYIGRKNFYSERNVPLGKREIEALKKEREGKKGRLPKKKLVKKLQKFSNYYSSNEELKKAHADGVEIKRMILEIAYGKQELSYLELKYQFKLEVIEKDNYLNTNILGKFYQSKLNLK